MALQYPSKRDRMWTAELSAEAGAFSAAQVIPGFVEKLCAMVKPGGGGSVLLQFTTDDEDIIDGNPGDVDWVDWTSGTVTTNTAQTALGAVTGVRIQAIAANAACSLAANTRRKTA